MDSIEKFRKKLIIDGRNFKWFHENYVKNDFTYGYFIKQINIPDSIQDRLSEIINEYLKG